MSPVMSDGVNGISIILWFLFFILYAYFQFKLSKKLDIQHSWMAWVPLLNFFNKLSIAGKTLGWFFKKIFLVWLLPIVIAWFGYSIFSWGKFAMTDTSALPIIAQILSFLTMMWIFGFIIYMSIVINHGISTRTGHGKWWTAGLIFAGWLFLPVTAIHYQKGDEVAPRPFVGWKKVLLIIFAIIVPITMVIGILAAALFPAMTTYLKRARDTARVSHIAQISTALMTYSIDNNEFPIVSTSGCFDSNTLAKYMAGVSPRDPVANNIMPGCDGTDGTYAYYTGTGSDGK